MWQPDNQNNSQDKSQANKTVLETIPEERELEIRHRDYFSPKASPERCRHSSGDNKINK